jgi:hypothetical protein
VAKIGQKSDPEDLEAMQTGKPVELKEEANFDATLPFHASSGKVIRAIGLSFKPRSGEQESDAVNSAQGMAGELEGKTSGAAYLFAAER